MTATAPPVVGNEALQAPQRNAEVAKVKLAFSSADSSQLSLVPGDLVEIVERTATGWIYGCLVTHPPRLQDGGNQTTAMLEGWFPQWACESTAAQRPVQATPWPVQPWTTN